MNPLDYNHLPSVDQVKEHIKYGEIHVEPKIVIKDVNMNLLIKLNEAIIWQNNAQSAITTKVSAQRLNHILREAKSVICKFNEHEALLKRAEVNKKISEMLHKKHKEEDLVILLQEAIQFDADDDFITAVQHKLQSAQELKARVKEILEGNLSDPTTAYTKILEEIKNTRTDLCEEKQMLEDKLKSLK